MANKIMSVEGRSKLKARASPYWHTLSSGCQLGFRKMTPTSVGSWLAQAYDPATRTQARKSLGAVDEVPQYQRFDAAKKLAEAWFEHLGRGGTRKIITVGDACTQYVSRVSTSGSPSNAEDLRGRFRRRVHGDPLEKIELTKLTRRHVEAWRERLLRAPVSKGRIGEEPVSQARSPSSVNRDMTAIRAALNHALDEGFVTTDAAWRVALRPISNADGRRDCYIDRSGRQALIGAAAGDLSAFLKGLSLVPLRPGALADLKVSNLHQQLQVLTIGKDKSGQDRRIKLPPQTFEFFKSLCVDKRPEAPVFTRENGTAWKKDNWKKPFKEAAKLAGLAPAVTAYAIRHSVITDLVTGESGAVPLDLLTVAQLSGTSVAMIERHYGHLRSDLASIALASLAV